MHSSNGINVRAINRKWKRDKPIRLNALVMMFDPTNRRAITYVEKRIPDTSGNYWL